MPLPTPEPGPLSGWRLALDRAPQSLSVVLLFAIPFLTQTAGTDILFPKWALTQALVGLMASIWLLETFLKGRMIFVRSKALVALLAFLLWSGATILLSPYSQAALSNWIDFLCIPLWYILLTFTCLESWRAENLLIVFLVSGLGSSLWAAGQALGIGEGPLLSLVHERFGGRVTAGMGDPGALAGYLQMVWPLALALLLRAERLASKVFWSLLLVSALSALFWTGSAAGWVGLLTGSILFAFFTWKDKDRQAFRWSILLGMVLILSALLSPVPGERKGFLNIKGAEAQVQSQIWIGALDIIKEHPLKGAGFGTFAAAFPSHRPSSLAVVQRGQSSEVAHAGNWALECLVGTGLVGFFLLLAFWYFVLAQWWKLYSANAIPKILGTGVFAAFGAVVADNLFDANAFLPSTLVPLLFLAAFPVALSRRFYRMEGFPIQLREIDLSGVKIYLLPLLVLAVGALLQQSGRAFERQAADVQLKTAMVLSREGKWDEALSRYEKVFHLDPSNLQANYSRAKIYSARGTEGDAEKALADLEAVGRVKPDHLQVHFDKGQILRRLGRNEESKAEMKRAIQLDPLLIFLWDDFKEARRLSTARKFAAALPLYQKMVLDYPNCVPLLTDYARCLLMTQRFPEAIGVYQKVRELDPGNREIPANIGNLSSIIPPDR